MDIGLRNALAILSMRGQIPIKTPEQIESMREAGIILRNTLEIVSKAVKPGISTFELDLIAEDFIISHKGAKPAFKGYRGFPATLCTSVNEQVVHGIPSKDVILSDGDIVGLDCGVYYDGLYTDACLTVLVGNVDPEVQHFVKITKKALNQAIKQVKPGNHIGDISAIIQKTLEDQGYLPVIECTGHGVGVDLHEPPEILNAGKKSTGPVMKEGMVLAIEPISAMGSNSIITLNDGWTIVTEDGGLSAHFEHTVLVTEKGCEILA
jgi:methionyl aminopeptidase